MSRACAVKTGGSVECWGYDYLGHTSPPRGGFLQVSAGYSAFACGIRSAGSVACLGNSSDGGLHLPTGKFSQVSAGADFVCGLTARRSIAWWGSNLDGEVSPPNGAFTQVSVGQDFACGLRPSGSVVCWSEDTFKQTKPPARRFAAISSGQDFACGPGDGSAWCWGDGAALVSSGVEATKERLAVKVTTVYRVVRGRVANSYNSQTCNRSLCRYEIPHGSQLTLIETPRNSAKWHFKNWVLNGRNLGSRRTLTFSLPARSTVADAVYVRVTRHKS